MTVSPTIQSTLSRYRPEILAALRCALKEANEGASPQAAAALVPFYGQMQYHLGWVDSHFSPVSDSTGKLMRPTLLLLAYEAAGAWKLNDNISGAQLPAKEGPASHLRRALPAAAAVELTHNFTLIHDDIEDGDLERHHQPTLWSIWGIQHGINTGDGMFALGRLALWRSLDEGVEPDIAVRLGEVLDQTCLVISEGQYLDISFESRLDISVSMYMDMIGRKTASLMACAAKMGALLGTRDEETIERLHRFGHAMGIAFQVRDDMLGIWASAEETGKTHAGDIYRRKKSLPVLHALEHANSRDKQFLQQIYGQASPITGEYVEEVLAIFARTETLTYCRAFLAKQCHIAHEALANVPHATSTTAARALDDLQTLVHFVEDIVKN
ncbi:MAG TPA: polyprenyl synthetase family protein [Ktedonobacteraceae bacterium]|jgi:geranylgeranyl diphosphate synthase type I|nr:polyprenyl synthetase family protein [Ktedonobacteraceae bacterium]